MQTMVTQFEFGARANIRLGTFRPNSRKTRAHFKYRSLARVHFVLKSGAHCVNSLRNLGRGYFDNRNI